MLSNNGIISKAKEAREKYLQAQENETSYLNEVADLIRQEVANNGGGSNVDFSKFKVGDYVDYKPELETETDETKKIYSLTPEKSGVSGDPQTISYESGLKWRILNINEDTGKIDIVADPTTEKVQLKGATGYNNGVYALNDMCEHLYSNKAKGVTARSINLADMEKNLTPDGFTARNNFININNIQYGTTKTARYTNYPNSYKNAVGSGVDVAEDKANTIMQPDIINAVDPYKESTYSNTLVSGYTSALTGNLTVTQTTYSISINPTNYGEASGVLPNSSAYWVASHYAEASQGNASFGLRVVQTIMGGNVLLYCSNYEPVCSNRLRPLVSLNASTLTEKMGDTWSVNL